MKNSPSLSGRLAALCVVVALVNVFGCHKSPPPAGAVAVTPHPSWQKLTERVRHSQKRLTDSRAGANAAADKYAPRISFDTSDLGNKIGDGLSKLPGVISVSESKTDQPTSRIIHLFGPSVPTRDEFSTAVTLQADGPVSLGRFELLYEEYLLQVRIAQIEQVVIARCLVKHHGLRCIYFENSTQADLFISEQLPLADGQETNTTQAAGRPLKGLILEPWLDANQSGYLGELADWEARDVAPLASQTPHLNPEIKEIDRVWKLILPRTERALDAEIQSIVKNTPCCLLIGDAHELLDNVNGVDGERCEYIRVKTKAWQETSPLDPNIWGR